MSFTYDLFDRRSVDRFTPKDCLCSVVFQSTGIQLKAEIKSISMEGLTLILPKYSHLKSKENITINIITIKNNNPEKIKLTGVISDCINQDNGTVIRVITKGPLNKDVWQINRWLDSSIERRNILSHYTEIEQRKRGVSDIEYPSLLTESVLPEYNRKLVSRRTENKKQISENRVSTDRRHTKPISNFKPPFFYQSIKSMVTVTRDLLIHFLPSRLAQLLIGKSDFAFIAHPRDFRDVWRMFPFAKFLPIKLVKLWFRYQWPFVASNIHVKGNNCHKKITGKLIISPLWTKQMMKNTDLAREKIVKAVKFSEKIGCKIVGLGAFTSIVTRDGFDVLGHSNVGVTTGNPLSASIAVANLLYAFKLLEKNYSTLKIAIVGAGGSVGSGCAHLLLGIIKHLHIIDINMNSLEYLRNSLKKIDLRKTYNTLISESSTLENVEKFDGIIVVTNSIGTVINEKHIKSGAVVIDCAQPKNVSSNVPITRKDVLAIESAIISSQNLDVQFDLDLASGEALGCLAESIVLSSLNHKKHFIIGKVNHLQAKDIFKAATGSGFKLAYFRNSMGYITEQDIERIKSIINNNQN